MPYVLVYFTEEGAGKGLSLSLSHISFRRACFIHITRVLPQKQPYLPLNQRYYQQNRYHDLPIALVLECSNPCIVRCDFCPRNGYHIDHDVTASAAATTTSNAVAALATPPANDQCSGAIFLPIGSGASADFRFATSDNLAVPIGLRDECGFLPSPGTGDGCNFPDGDVTYVDLNSVGVWYRFVGNGRKLWINSTSSCLGGPENGIRYSIYTGRCGNTTLQCVAGQGGRRCSFERTVILDSKAGTTYYLLVHLGGFERNYTSTVSVTNAPVPINDDCRTATPLVIGTSIPAVELTFAKFDLAPPAPFCGYDAEIRQGLWYTFTGTGGTWAISSARLDYQLYKGRSCGSTSLQCVVNGVLEAGTKYYLRVGTYNDVSFALFDLLVSNVIPTPVVPTGSFAAHDTCVNAVPMTVGSSITDFIYWASANDSPFVPNDCVTNTPIGNRRGLWYSFDGTGGTVGIGLCLRGDSSVSVYSGICGASSTATALQCVAGSTDSSCTSSNSFASDLSFPTIVGAKYYILVHQLANAVPVNDWENQIDLVLYNPGQRVAPAPVAAPLVAPQKAVAPPVRKPVATSPVKSPKTGPVVAPVRKPVVAKPVAAPKKPVVAPKRPVAAPKKTATAPVVRKPVGSPKA